MYALSEIQWIGGGCAWHTNCTLSYLSFSGQEASFRWGKSKKRLRQPGLGSGKGPGIVLVGGPAANPIRPATGFFRSKYEKEGQEAEGEFIDPGTTKR